MSSSEKILVKVISPVKHDGKLKKPGKTYKMPREVVEAAPWCFEVIEEPEPPTEAKASEQTEENATPK